MKRKIKKPIAAFLITQMALSALPGICLNTYAAEPIKVEVQNGPVFKVTNTSATNIDLSKLVLKYYYTADGKETTYDVYYAATDNGNVVSTSSRIGSCDSPVSTADKYVELIIGSGTLPSNKTLFINGALHNKDWSNLNTGNDYSYPASTSFMESNKVTAYVDNVLSSGIEPTSTPEPISDKGIKRYCYNNADFTSLKSSSITNDISAPENAASIRWVGKIKPLESCTVSSDELDDNAAYDFTVETSGKVRLWIDNVLYIDEWNDTTTKNKYHATVRMENTKEYDLRMEYSNTNEDKSILFDWESYDKIFYGKEYKSSTVGRVFDVSSKKTTLELLESDKRDGSFKITVQDSNDKVNWTDIYTFQKDGTYDYQGTKKYLRAIATVSFDSTNPKKFPPFFILDIKRSQPVKFDVLKPASGETISPSISGAPIVTAKTNKAISLSWAASTDNERVCGYDIYRNDEFLTSTASNKFTDIDLIPGETYKYAVRAYDPSGNVSPLSESVEVTTDADVANTKK